MKREGLAGLSPVRVALRSIRTRNHSRTEAKALIEALESVHKEVSETIRGLESAPGLTATQVFERIRFCRDEIGLTIAQFRIKQTEGGAPNA